MVTKPQLTIVGAGMAGLLCASLLRSQTSKIVETQKSLPNNHSAVLRFRSNAVGEALGIPFRKVTMIKTALPWLNPVADALAYSRKNNGVARTDRSITDGLVVGERFIAPPDLIARMAAGKDINYGCYYQFDPKHTGPIVSTLPMPVLMKLLDYPFAREVEFNYVSGLNIKATVQGCDAYATLVVPDPDQAFSRISITGNELIVEVPNFNMKHFDTPNGAAFLTDLAERNAENAAKLLGFTKNDLSDITVHSQQYAKIAPIDDDLRKDFIYWGTHRHNVFSLGRFATWRPKLLLDDLIKDIGLIGKWVDSNSRYAVARHR